MATVFPQSIHHHPLAQRLDAHVQTHAVLTSFSTASVGPKSG